MGVEHELGGIPFARPSLEVVEQKASPAPTARLGAQIQVLHLIADAVLAVRDAPDAAAAHGTALVVRQHDEDAGGLGEDVRRGKDVVYFCPGKLSARIAKYSARSSRETGSSTGSGRSSTMRRA